MVIVFLANHHLHLLTVWFDELCSWMLQQTFSEKSASHFFCGFSLLKCQASIPPMNVPHVFVLLTIFFGQHFLLLIFVEVSSNEGWVFSLLISLCHENSHLLHSLTLSKSSAAVFAWRWCFPPLTHIAMRTPLSHFLVAMLAMIQMTGDQACFGLKHFCSSVINFNSILVCKADFWCTTTSAICHCVFFACLKVWGVINDKLVADTPAPSSTAPSHHFFASDISATHWFACGNLGRLTLHVSFQSNKDFALFHENVWCCHMNLNVWNFSWKSHWTTSAVPLPIHFSLHHWFLWAFFFFFFLTTHFDDAGFEFIVLPLHFCAECAVPLTPPLFFAANNCLVSIHVTSKTMITLEKFGPVTHCTSQALEKVKNSEQSAENKRKLVIIEEALKIPSNPQILIFLQSPWAWALLLEMMIQTINSCDFKCKFSYCHPCCLQPAACGYHLFFSASNEHQLIPQTDVSVPFNVSRGRSIVMPLFIFSCAAIQSIKLAFWMGALSLVLTACFERNLQMKKLSLNLC